MISVLNSIQSYSGFEPLSDADFAHGMKTVVEPFLDKLRKTHELKTDKGSLYCETFVPDNSVLQKKRKVRGLVVLFHGFCEFCSKFDEFTYYVLQQGYAVCRFDQFGHGFSERETRDSSKVHILRFQKYVDCAYEVVEKIALPLAEKQDKDKNPLPVFLFAHSMGGAVGALFLEQYPDIFTAAVFSSPMLELPSKGLPESVARFLIHLMRLFGRAESYFSGQSAFDGTYSFSDAKALTCSKNRFLYHFNKRNEEVRYQTWGGTFAWLDESFGAIKKIFKKKALKAVKTPLLVFQAEKDSTVSNGGQNRFVRAVGCARLLICPGANHELYNGTDETLKRWYPELFRFYDEFTS